MLDNLLGSLKSEIGGEILSQTQLPANNLGKVFSVIGDVTKKAALGGIAKNLFGNFLKR